MTLAAARLVAIRNTPTMYLPRRIVQIASLVGLNSGFWPATQVKWLCNPVLNCHACALAWFACPIGVLVNYSGNHLFPFVAVGTLVLAGALLGRLLCGWVCPFGTLQDFLHKIPSPKFSLPKWTSWIKYVVLAGGVIAFPFLLGPGTWLVFCRICPAASLQSTIPSWFTDGFSWLGWWSTTRFAVLGLVVVLAVLSSRSFCKVLCPIGALLAPFNHFSLWSVQPPTKACVSCGRCDRACPTEVTPSMRILEGTAPNRALDCITCHDCQPVCPVRDEDIHPKTSPQSPDRSQSESQGT